MQLNNVLVINTIDVNRMANDHYTINRSLNDKEMVKITELLDINSEEFINEMLDELIKNKVYNK